MGLRVSVPLALLLLNLAHLFSFSAIQATEKLETAAPSTPSKIHFRVVLDSPGGPLPFGLEIIEESGDRLRGTILNAEERIPVDRIEWTESLLIVGFDHYASRIEVEPVGRGRYRGRWTKRSPGGRSVLSATFERIPEAVVKATPRFPRETESETDPTPSTDVSGEWKVLFRGKDGTDSSPAVARFEQNGSHLVGTFLTPTGDYRYLEGDVHQDFLRLSCFDGAHAFLFHGKLSKGSIEGDFWSRDSWHETWEARRTTREDASAHLPDPFSMTEIVEGKKLGFRFPDVDGNVVSLDDEQFSGHPVMVEIFGTWCPNCHDAAPVLRSFKEKYAESGLKVIGLAYEISGDPAKDAEQIRRYAEKYGCDWPILLAGTSSKSEASKTLPFLSSIKSYPTTLFLDRSGRVRRIYTGFSGPATGENYENLLRQWDETLAEIVK